MRAKFGETVQRARMEKRIPLKRIADSVGISVPYVSDIEHGYRNPPSPERIYRWASALNLDGEDLVDLALISRGTVDLEIGDARPSRQLVALALARTWEHLTPDEEQELLSTLEKFQRSKS